MIIQHTKTWDTVKMVRNDKCIALSNFTKKQESNNNWNRCLLQRAGCVCGEKMAERVGNDKDKNGN